MNTVAHHAVTTLLRLVLLIVNPNINHDTAGLQPFTLDELSLANGGDDLSKK